jgi:hypothetical protein
MDLTAVIVAMQGDRIMRVMCKTCRKERGYKSPKGVEEPSLAPKAKSSSPRTPVKVTSMEEEWMGAMSKIQNKRALPYSTTLKLSQGDLVSHPTFGDGIVQKIIHPNKVELLFRTDLKVLLCAGQRM